MSDGGEVGKSCMWKGIPNDWCTSFCKLMRKTGICISLQLDECFFQAEIKANFILARVASMLLFSMVLCCVSEGPLYNSHLELIAFSSRNSPLDHLSSWLFSGHSFFYPVYSVAGAYCIIYESNGLSITISSVKVHRSFNLQMRHLDRRIWQYTDWNRNRYLLFPKHIICSVHLSSIKEHICERAWLVISVL